MLCNCIELLFQVDVTVGNVPGEETCKKKGKGIRYKKISEERKK